jgi:hypothetical protein
MAVTTSTQVANNAWTLLGGGPMNLQAVEGDCFIQDATSTPTGSGGFLLRKTDGRTDFNTTNNVYAMSAAPVIGSQVAHDTVVWAPVTA